MQITGGNNGIIQTQTIRVDRREQQEDDRHVHAATTGSKHTVTGGHIDPTSHYLITRPEISAVRRRAPTESRHIDPEFAKACVLSRRKLN